MVLVIVICFSVISVVVHIGTFIVMGRLLSIPIEDAAFFLGPKVAKLHFATFDLKIGIIPYSGYVTFANDVLEKSGLLKKSLLMLSGCASLFFVAGAFRGFDVTAHSVMDGFSEIVTGAISPIKVGRPLVAEAHHFLATNTIWAGLSAVFAKLCAFNLLPLTVMNGGNWMLRCVKTVVPISERIEFTLALVSFILALALHGLWGIAFVRYLIG